MSSALRYLVSADDKASATFRRIRGEIAGLQGGMSSLSRVIGPIGPQLAGAFTVAALGAWVKRTVEGVDALNDLADATGDTVENLSALEDVALRTGTSMDAAGDAVVKLNKALGEAAKDPDSQAGQAIRNLGLNIKDLLALSPVERLQAVGRALNSFDGENKLFYNLTLLGKGTRELAPLLKDLGEAGQLQAKVTTQQAAEAEKLRKEWSALEKSALDLSRTLIGPVVSALNTTSEAYKRAREEGVGFLEFALRRVGQDNRPGSSAEAEDRASRKRELAGELERIDALLARGVMMEQKRNELIAKRAVLQANFTAVRINEALAGAGDIPQDPRLRDTSGGKLPALRDEGGKKRKDEIDDASRALANYVAGLSRAIEAEKNLSAEQEAQTFLKSLGVTGEVAQVRELVLGLAAEKDMREDIAAQAKLDDAARAAIIAKQLADQEQLNRLLAATPTGQEKERLATVLLINKAFDEGVVTLGQWVELMDQIDGKVEDIADKAKDDAREIGLIFASAAGEAITHWQGFGNLIKGILQDVAQLLLKKTVTDPLSNWMGNSLKGFDFASLTEGFDWSSVGSFIGNLFGGGMAGGGSVQAGRFYEVNERNGPGELLRVGSRQYLMPRRDGQVIPTSQASAQAAGATIVFNIGAGASVDDWRRSERQVTSSLQRSLRRAGAIA